MFEQLGEPEKPPKVSIAMSLGLFVAYMVGALGGLGLVIAFGDRPFGIQIVTAITYTYFAFWYIFFPAKGMLERYSLSDKRVQQEFPRILAIHCAFLILVFVVQTTLFAIKPRLPAYWLIKQGTRQSSWYELLIVVPFVAMFFTQVLISRRSLRRSLEKRGGFPAVLG